MCAGRNHSAAAAAPAAGRGSPRGFPDPGCVAWLRLVQVLQEERTWLVRTGRQQHWELRRALRGSKAGLGNCSLVAERPADCCGAVAGPGAEAGPEEAEAGPGSVLGFGPGEAEERTGSLWEARERWSHSCQTL